MRLHLPALVLALGLATAGCSIGFRSSSASASGVVALGEGARAEGRIGPPAAEDLRLDLLCEGPGGVRFALRRDGTTLTDGEMGAGDRLAFPALRVPPSGDLVVAIEALPGGATAVRWTLSGTGPVECAWSQRESPAPAPR